MHLSPGRLEQHQAELAQCTLCSEMQGPPVSGEPCSSPVMLVGQAPGFKEIEVHKPFAWTAGKTLFKWFQQIGFEEDWFRQHVYMSAVCRCFPGKFKNGIALKNGDRVPTKQEISNCHQWLSREIDIIQPELIIPVGKLAISQFIAVNKLSEVIGHSHSTSLSDSCSQLSIPDNCELIPLPHPSGASTWPRTEPGKSLTSQALQLIQQHPAWKKVR